MVDERAEEATTDLEDTGKLPVISADAESSEVVPEDSGQTQAADVETAQSTAAVADGSAVAEDSAAAGTKTGAAEDAGEGEQTLEFREIPKAAMRKQKSPLPVIAIALAVLLAVGGLVAAIVLLPGYGGSRAVDASDATAQEGNGTRASARTDVTIPIQVPGLDEKGSRVPLRAVGTDVDGNKFSEVQYVTHEGVGMRLPLGSYEVHVVESPITAQGVMYDLPLEGIKVSVYVGGNVSFEPKDAVLQLTPAHPESINDNKIETARKMILEDPQKKDLASKLAKLVSERRKKAVAYLADKRREMRSREDEHEDDEEKEDEEKDKDKDDDSGNKDSNNGSKGNNSGSKSQSKDSGNSGKDDSGSKDDGGSNSGGGEQSNESDSHSDNGGGGEQQQSGGSDGGGGESGDAGGGDTGGNAGGDAGGEPAPQPEPSAGGEAGGEQPPAEG